LEKVANTGVEKARAANEWRENAPVKPGQWTGAMQNAAQQMMPAIIKEAKDKGEKIDQAQAWQRAQARVTQSLNPSVTPQQAAQVPGMMQGQWQNDINVTPGQGGARIVDPSAYAAAPPRAPGNNDRNGWFDPAMRKPVPYNMNTPEIRAYDLTSQAPQVPVPSAPYVPPSQNVGGWGETGQPPMLPSQSLPTDRMLNRWQQYDKSPKNPVLPSSRRTPEDFYSQMFPWIPTGTY
jgi:hypothetical protein